jgi:hypothetical protein
MIKTSTSRDNKSAREKRLNSMTKDPLKVKMGPRFIPIGPRTAFRVKRDTSISFQTLFDATDGTISDTSIGFQ